MRAPLLIPNESRDTAHDKDSWAVNCFLEREDADRAVKRPGLVNTVDIFDGDVGQGVFIWPELNGPKIIVLFDDALFILEPYDGPIQNGTVISDTEMILDDHYITLQNFGGNSQFYVYANSNSYNDEVWMEDPDTGRLVKYYAATPSSKRKKIVSGWAKNLWSKTPITATTRWRTPRFGSFYGEGSTTTAAGAAYLAQGAPDSFGNPNFPRSGVDNQGRSYVENIDALDFLPTTAQIIVVAQANPPYQGYVYTYFMNPFLYLQTA